MALENNKEKIVLTGLILYDLRCDHSDPKNADTDNDGIPDGKELEQQLDPTKPDSDGDAVRDGEDAFPLNPAESQDTDADGVGNQEDTDDDNDTISDEEEVRLGSDPLVSETPDEKSGASKSLDFLGNAEQALFGSEDVTLKRIVQFGSLGSFLLFLVFYGLYRVKKYRL